MGGWGWGDGSPRILESGEGVTKSWGFLVGMGECDLKKRWHLHVPLRCVNLLCRAAGPGTQKPVCVAQREAWQGHHLGAQRGVWELV